MSVTVTSVGGVGTLATIRNAGLDQSESEPSRFVCIPTKHQRPGVVIITVAVSDCPGTVVGTVTSSSGGEGVSSIRHAPQYIVVVAKEAGNEVSVGIMLLSVFKVAFVQLRVMSAAGAGAGNANKIHKNIIALNILILLFIQSVYNYRIH